MPSDSVVHVETVDIVRTNTMFVVLIELRIRSNKLALPVHYNWSR